jgi:hypothetical protein
VLFGSPAHSIQTTKVRESMVKHPSTNDKDISKRKGGKREPMIDKPLAKELAQDIEASGKTRQEFNLLSLCEQKSYVYGAEGDQKRRYVQKTFSNLKRKSPLNYQKWLDKARVSAGEALKREIRELMGEDDDTSSASESQYESGDEEDEEDEEDSLSSTAVSKISKKSKKSRKSTSSKKSTISKKSTQSTNQPNPNIGKNGDSNFERVLNQNLIL